jgi:hypothetical protein
VRAAAVKNVMATNAAKKKKERGERKVEDGAKGVDGGLASRSFHDQTGKQEGAQLSAANRESPTRFLRT